jgi:hypothetical protein
LYESTYRGQPDQIQRIPTPKGGLPGSKGALLMRSLATGIPGSPSQEMQQDDLLINVSGRLGGFLPVNLGPSVVVRVYLPPFEQWEQRTGCSFALRADVEGTTTKPQPRRFFFAKEQSIEMENYWPGMFLQFNSKAGGQNKEDSALILIRSGERGEDFVGRYITQTGWWTLGMSFTSDGQVHYYARPGVGDLTQADHMASRYPYGNRCQRFHTFFFNVVNQDDGRSWSTPWVVDDPALYLVHNR